MEMGDGVGMVSAYTYSAIANFYFPVPNPQSPFNFFLYLIKFNYLLINNFNINQFYHHFYIL